jgi:hypothetical protein
VTWTPLASPAVVYSDDEVIVYIDATWRALATPERFQLSHDAEIHANHPGDHARLYTRDGRCKISKVTSPSGRLLDFRAIAAGAKP